jgi:hypothetical protein
VSPVNDDRHAFTSMIRPIAICSDGARLRERQVLGGCIFAAKLIYHTPLRVIEVCREEPTTGAGGCVQSGYVSEDLNHV